MKVEKRCSRCVMTSKGDREIRFDKYGYCNYCTDGLAKLQKRYFPNEEGARKLNEALTILKEKNKDREYDCLMGISGGLDSCYLAYLGAVKWGLRIAAIHIDDGFDTDICKSNIMKLCDKAGIELKYISPDAKQYYELCRAYMLAGVPNLAVPQDNILFSEIYLYAKEYNILDFLSGVNYSLESILQTDNSFDVYDLVNIKDINNRFGRCSMDKLNLSSRRDMDELQKEVQIKTYDFLNFIDYNRKRALKELHEFCGFEYYGSKHLENYYTGFLQLVWLPQKFNVDKRTSHLSSMIISGQMSRDEALEELRNVPYPDGWIETAEELIMEKLDFSDEEFESVLNEKAHNHTDYRYSFAPYWKSKIWRKMHLLGLL